MKFVSSSNGPWDFFDPAGSNMPSVDWTDQLTSDFLKWVKQIIILLFNKELC